MDEGSVAAALVVAGENIVDLVPVDDAGTFRALAGGSPANIAIAASRLGTPTAMLARFGADVFGRRARARLVADAVDLSLSVDAAAPSSLAAVSFDEHRRASYDFWLDGTADWGWTDDSLPARLPDGVAVLHVGSMAAYREPGASALLALARREQARGEVAVTFDPNVRPAVVPDLAAGLTRTREIAARCVLVKASDEDLAHLYPGSSWRQAAGDLLAQGPAIVVVTLGGEGAVAVRAGSEVAVAAPVVAVVDTVGAGDTVMGALLSGLLAAGLLTADGSALRAASDDALAGVLTRAVTAAALNCTRAGADPPTGAELSAYLTPTAVTSRSIPG